MDEHGEFPHKEQTVVSPELNQKMVEATAAVKEGMAEPGADIAGPTQQLGMFAELWQVQKEYGVKKLGIMFKDAKVAFGILPFVNKISEKMSVASGEAPSLMRQVNESLEADISASKAERTLTKAQKKLEAKQKGTFLSKFQFRNETTLSQKVSAAESTLHTKKALQAETFLKANEAMQSAKGKALSPEGFVPKNIRKLTGVKTGTDYIRNYNDWNSRTDLNLKEIDRLRGAANGEAPPRNKKEKFTRGAKFVGTRVVLEHLGPIINPVPDVPGLVTLASYGAELFGGQWWAGLIPPVWQYAHNRYEDFAASFEMSKKATEIVKKHWEKKFGTLKEPQVAKAAEVFSV